MNLAVAGLLALTLGACATVPAPRPLNPQANAHAIAARRLDDPGLGAAELRLGLSGNAKVPWTPDRMVVAGWYFNPALTQAHAAAARAAADAVLSAQRANPTLELSPEKVFSGLAGTSPWTVGVALLLPLLHPGEAAARRDVAAAESQSARDQEALAVWHSRVQTLAALREVLLARRAQALAQVVAQDDAEYLAAVQRRVAAGEDGRGARLAAQLDAQRAASDLATRRAQRVAAEHALAAAVGVPETALNAVTLDWPGLESPPEPAALPPEALAKDAAWNRLDLAALLARYRAAAAQLRLAAGRRYPTTSVAPGYLYDQGQRKFTFGINVELPLFHGAGARIRAAAAARDEAAAAVTARQALILNQLDATRAAYAERYAAWQSMAAAAATAKKTAVRAAAMRKAGQASHLAELTAQVASATAALAAQDALSATLNALARLEDALQRPLWPGSKLPSVPAANAISASSDSGSPGAIDVDEF